MSYNVTTKLQSTRQIRITTAMITNRGLSIGAELMSWVPARYGPQHGVMYPLYELSGERAAVYRFKSEAGASNGKKYAWIGTDDDKTKPHYYHVSNIQQVIGENGGTLYIVAGEPDVLTLISAGYKNVLCWYGELNIPQTLIDNLNALGVTRAIYIPDRDDTGQKARAKVIRVFAASDNAPDLLIVDLPGDLESKNDLNAEWIISEFDPLVIEGLLLTAQPPDQAQPELPRQQPASRLQPVPDDVEQLWSQYCSDVEQAAIAAWSIPLPNASSFSRKNFTCPFHDDNDPSASWNYETHSLKCFSCGDFDIKLIAENLGVETWDDFKARHRTGSPERPDTPDNIPSSTDDENRRLSAENRITTDRHALDELERKMNGDDPDLIPPIPNPFTALHIVGGMGDMLWPRQILGIMAPPGTGKTSVIECMLDLMQQRGVWPILWGPEWSPYHYQMRRVARYGGPLVDAQKAHMLYMNEARRGASANDGVRMSQDAWQKQLEIAERIRRWPGQCTYIDRKDRTIEDLIGVFENLIGRLRAKNKQTIVAIDYLQLAQRFGKGGWDQFELLMGMVRTLSIDLRVPVIVSVQPTKTASGNAQTGQPLTTNDAQGVSEQQFTMFMSLSAVYRDGIRQPKTRVAILKNNEGLNHPGGGFWIDVPAIPERLWVDGRTIGDTSIPRQLWRKQRTSAPVQQDTLNLEPI